MLSKQATQMYPESKAIKTWKQGKLVFSIVRHTEMGHLCGYVRFPKRPVREQHYEGILTYIPVHGGITYAQESKDESMVYGFDTAHCDDWSKFHPDGKKWTEEEIKAETERMAHGILLASKYEKRYLQSLTNKGKARIIDQFHKELGIAFKVQDNFGAMINLLAGHL